MKSIRKIILLLILLSPFIAFAQPEWEDEPDDVPLDGGISLLVGAALVYGAKKLRNTETFRNK